jgi:hypothetical protein
MVSKPEVIQKRGLWEASDEVLCASSATRKLFWRHNRRYITREIAHKQFFLRWPCHAFGQADLSTILGLQEVGILGK